MKKKLMVLAAGALAALALMALPTGASAGEPPLTCTSLPCTYTIEGGTTEFSTTGGLTVKCTSATGTGAYNALEGTTGSVQITFHGCKEQVFNTACTGFVGGVEQPKETVKTNSMVTHNIFIEPKTSEPDGTPGVLLTNTSTTFRCLGLNNTVTGSVIGHLEEPSTKCNTNQNEYTLNFEVTGHGQQKYKNITTNPALGVFDLSSNNDAGGAYTTAAQKGTGHIKFNQTVKLTCTP